jgi:RNA-binding protein 39
MQFARLEDAKAAQSLNGQLDIAGRVIKVTLVDMYYVASKIVVNF